PVMTIIIGVLFYKSKISLPISVGLLIGFSGSLVLSFVSGDGGIGSFNFYALFVIAATLLYGISGNMSKEYVKTINPVVLVALATLLTMPVSLTILFISDFSTRVATHPDALFSLLSIFVLGSIGTAFALAIFNQLIKNTSAVFASSTTYLIPIVAIGWGFIDGEALYPLHFAGMGLIIVGIVILNRYK
nr:DMT family transporter [Melioribacteraceae bacterium]